MAGEGFSPDRLLLELGAIGENPDCGRAPAAVSRQTSAGLAPFKRHLWQWWEWW